LLRRSKSALIFCEFGDLPFDSGVVEELAEPVKWKQDVSISIVETDGDMNLCPWALMVWQQSHQLLIFHVGV